ncbi:hypothetical protein GLYMA_07G124150v4 [Glycine max]|nr:hypothetical protein GLYMA_07G124150v4 [Glycine max]KAH1086557.1 hypothetical protein GYH30_018192 [Glycine max]
MPNDSRVRSIINQCSPHFSFFLIVEFSYITNITLMTKESWNIIVRVLRLWFVPSLNGKGLRLSMEMVLLRMKGDKIHVSLRKTLIYKFIKDIKEDLVYKVGGDQVVLQQFKVLNMPPMVYYIQKLNTEYMLCSCYSLFFHCIHCKLLLYLLRNEKYNRN